MKILVIKFSAAGDVLRTTALLHGIKRKWPESEVWWITSQDAVDLLKENDYIDILLTYGRDDIDKTDFDLLICLDKEKESIELAVRLKAERKIGFGCDKSGNLSIFNKESEYAYQLGISDELKFKLNKKTYQEIIYQMCGLEYRNDKYVLNLKDAELTKARDKLDSLGIKQGDFVVGLNSGAGTRFANKIWGFQGHKSLIEEILKRKDVKVLLLGGRKERELNQKLKKAFGDSVYDSGVNNELREFASIIGHCNAVISGDTLAMHLAIALDKYVIAIFGPTCSQEIELYCRGVKIVSDIECAPCYKKRCNKKDNCMSRIGLEDVIKTLVP
ncbi:MAG: glycosyltransferase family 9 protein [Candidatus Omnitrophica bacterium]|nr:glycosyltransferase family 9 protein [Candidatus Omnitrophota bacterium]